MINWLYFCAGISISYNRLLEITRDLANRILHQYERDGVFVLRNLKKNIFTIMAETIIFTVMTMMLDQQLTPTTTMEHRSPSFSFHL